MKMKDFFTMVTEILPNGARVRYESVERAHYFITPYKYSRELPVRVNMENYIDIGEGILACLEDVEKDIETEDRSAP
jgi:UDP-glucose 4-epimerase